MDGDQDKIICNFKGLPSAVSLGSTIYLGTGKVHLEVTEVLEVSKLYWVNLIVVIC
jgi:pyruvate kinase